MKKIMKHLLAIAFIGVFAGCDTMWGTLQKFEVFQSFTLSSDQADMNGQYEDVQFQVGQQNTQVWKVKTFKKKKVMNVALVRASDKKQFTLDPKEFEVKFDKVGSTPVETPWVERTQTCFYQATFTECDSLGHCYSRVVTVQGWERVRTRTVGSMDDYHVALNNKANAFLAALDVTMDNTQTETQVIWPCR